MPPKEVLGKDLEALVSREISINPNTKRYNRKYFIDKAGDYFDLGAYYQALQENKGNAGAMSDISKLLIPSNPSLLLNRGSDGILLAADTALSEAEKALAEYSDNLSLVEKLDAEQLNKLIISLANPERPLIYRTENRAHERLAEIVKRQALISSGKREELIKDLPELMEDAPLWHKVIFSRYQGDQSYMTELLSSYASIISTIYSREFSKEVIEKGKKKRVPDEDKLFSFYKRNIKVVESERDSEPEEKVKYDIWSKYIAPIHLTSAGLLYKSEKKAQKQEVKGKTEDRKRHRAELGIAT